MRRVLSSAARLDPGGPPRDTFEYRVSAREVKSNALQLAGVSDQIGSFCCDYLARH